MFLNRSVGIRFGVVWGILNFSDVVSRNLWIFGSGYPETIRIPVWYFCAALPDRHWQIPMYNFVQPREEDAVLCVTGELLEFCRPTPLSWQFPMHSVLVGSLSLGTGLEWPSS